MDAEQIALLLVIVAAAVGIYFFFGSFALGAGYQPTPRRVVDRMLTSAGVGPRDTVFDLGAGTGAIVFAAARRYGASVVGVEAEPFRVLVLRLRRRFGGPRDRVEIRRMNIFAVDLRPATVVAVFLWPGAMARLQPLFEEQLRPGSRVVSHWHRVPGWEVELFDVATQVYLYRWPEAQRSQRPATGGR
ncbi:MAG: class I SAM-dependent methyltransferase [Thermoplasmata archaeon]